MATTGRAKAAAMMTERKRIVRLNDVDAAAGPAAAGDDDDHDD